MYDELVRLSHNFLQIKNSSYRRYLIQKNSFKNRFSIILGPRGVGKTTTIVQLLLDQVEGDLFDPRILYIQADHFQIGSTTLYEIAEQFQTLGGQWIAFDEIHKYPDWSKELKSICDTFPNLTIYASGSSALEIHHGSHDLSRRAINYKMQGLSFREHLELTFNIELPTLALEEVCSDHVRLASEIIEVTERQKKKIIPLFNTYVKAGFYPYFKELNDEALYLITLEQNLHTTLESDLTAIYPHLSGSSINKLRRLLTYISNSVPFQPNWKKIMDLLEIGDSRTLKSYFKHLEEASLVQSIGSASSKLKQLENSEKVYLDNPNLLHAISSKEPEKGTIRETFFLKTLSKDHQVTIPKRGDFLVDQELLFEVGGKNKTFDQIRGKTNSYLACDGIERGARNKIPLWLFGFLY